MDTKKLLLENSLKFSFPFLALLMSYYFFNISDWVKPINDIKDAKLKWAFDLAFNTSIINIAYELLKAKFKPSVMYNIDITDKKLQNSITLSAEEAQELLPLKCNITIEKEKWINNEIIIDYPRWLTLELDSVKHSNSDAFDHKKDKNVLIIRPEFIFNENIKTPESYEISMKVIPRIINNLEGNIQAKVKANPKYKAFYIKSKIKVFKIKILEG